MKETQENKNERNREKKKNQIGGNHKTKLNLRTTFQRQNRGKKIFKCTKAQTHRCTSANERGRGTQGREAEGRGGGRGEGAFSSLLHKH